MKIGFVDNPQETIALFVEKFVMPWDEFRESHIEWIAECAQNNYPIDINWYNNCHLWDKATEDFEDITFHKALSLLKELSQDVLFTTEANRTMTCCGTNMQNFVAQADSVALAQRIEYEWYTDFELTPQDRSDPAAFLPDDLYVFDRSMKWCIVFTHECYDWQYQWTEPLKTAATRICKLCMRR